MAKYDVIAVGGGTAGLVTAAGSAGLGARVALVERERLGGECLWTGCVPSKALLAAARVAAGARDGQRFGVRTRDVDADLGGALEWVRAVQQRIAPHDSPERFQGLGVDVIQGEARFTGERTLTVGGRTLTARHIVLATGSDPAIPPIPGLDAVPYHTNETIFTIGALPSTLLVLGGGAIGLEMAQAFARFGSRVHVVDTASRLLPHEDQELAELLTARLSADGVQLHLGESATQVARRGGGGAVRLTLVPCGSGPAAATASHTLDGDALLVATGRTARLEALELARGGVEGGAQGITVDAALRTTARGVWAAGDCVGPLRFTHVADFQARLVIRNALFPFTRKADYAVVPWVTFTDPELAHVGLTESEARERYGDRVRVWRRPFAEVDRAVTDGETTGLVKLVTTLHGRILGGHVLGHGAGSLIGEIALAMKHGISASALGNTLHPYPTYPEAIRQAAELYTRSRFTGPVKAVARWFARR